MSEEQRIKALYLMDEVYESIGPSIELDKKLKEFFNSDIRDLCYTESLDAALYLLELVGGRLDSLHRRTQPEMGGRMFSAHGYMAGHIRSRGHRNWALAICELALIAFYNG